MVDLGDAVLGLDLADDVLAQVADGSEASVGGAREIGEVLVLGEISGTDDSKVDHDLRFGV